MSDLVTKGFWWEAEWDEGHLKMLTGLLEPRPLGNDVVRNTVPSSNTLYGNTQITALISDPSY